MTEQTRRPAPTHRPDYVLLGATVALLVISTLMVYSSSFVIAHNEFGDDLYFLTRHVAALGLGLGCLAVLARVDYRFWRNWSLVLLALSVGLLVLVLIPGVGLASYGSVRWLKVGPIQIQPSEVAKLALALYLADWMARRGPRQVGHFANGMLPFLVIVVLVGGLVEFQPDLGTTMILVGIAGCIFFVAGANLLHVGALASMGVLGVIALISRMSGYRQDRIAAFLDPWSDLQGHGWHTVQTLIALGSGGLTGSGLGNGFQKFYWVPNAHTDAIFAIIGEEMGFLGTMTVLGLYGLVTWRGFLVAFRAPDVYGRLLATGLTCKIALQALLNMAVVTNTVPFTGVTLPLMSYGNSSNVVSLCAIGLLLGISRYRRAPNQPVVEAEQHGATRGAPQPRVHSHADTPEPVRRRRASIFHPRGTARTGLTAPLQPSAVRRRGGTHRRTGRGIQDWRR